MTSTTPMNAAALEVVATAVAQASYEGMTISESIQVAEAAIRAYLDASKEPVAVSDEMVRSYKAAFEAKTYQILNAENGSLYPIDVGDTATRAGLAAVFEALAPATLAVPGDVVERIADDIRAVGWTVAIHNDYRLDGEDHTFWLFTKDGAAIKGEGKTDADALNAVRAAIAGVAALPVQVDAVAGEPTIEALRIGSHLLLLAGALRNQRFEAIITDEAARQLEEADAFIQRLSAARPPKPAMEGVTEAMVDVALGIWFETNEPWYAGMANGVIEGCERQMRAALEAAGRSALVQP